MTARVKKLAPLVLVFILLNNFFLLGRHLLEKYGIDNTTLIIANSLFFVISILVYKMQQKSLQNTNPNVFIRNVMAGTLIKMLVAIIALVVYAMAFKNSFNKKTVVACLVIYFVYLAVETRIAMQLNKNKNV